jgi:hypothetical protein
MVTPFAQILGELHKRLKLTLSERRCHAKVKRFRSPAKFLDRKFATICITTVPPRPLHHRSLIAKSASDRFEDITNERHMPTMCQHANASEWYDQKTSKNR